MRTPAEALDALRARPGAAAVLAVLARRSDVWIVGGAVRDALLGREPREFDIAVEGPTETLAAALGGTVLAAHERFGTATVERDGLRLDLARTRAERYAAPGALPDVVPAGIEDDLRRRDVTVNAIALRPADGEVLAVPKAFDDLAAGRLRVLHDASFVDDPTRLWRVARYAARLGFAPDPHTAALAAAADPARISSPVRLGNELRLALREPDPLAALRAARDLNPRLLPARLDLTGDGARAALALLPPGEGRRDLVVLAAAARPVDAAELVAWLDAQGLTAAERDIVAAGSREAVVHPLRVAAGPAEIARAARNVPVEIVALAGGPNARRWIDELRHVRLDITGDDLIAAGVPEGPELGARLRRVLDRKLAGELAGRDAELAAALE